MRIYSLMQALTHNKQHHQQQPTILVADDNEDNLIYISHALTMYGYRGVATKDATKTISLAQEYQPDLIILDIKMPHLSGIDLIQILKSDWLTRRIPMIAVTALATENEKKQILAAGFQDYLVKPFFLEDLRKVICLNVANTFLC